MNSVLGLFLLGSCIFTGAHEGEEDYSYIMPEEQLRVALSTLGSGSYYVLVKIVNVQTDESRWACIETLGLLTAFRMEHEQQVSRSNYDEIVDLILATKDRTFRFSNQEAFKKAYPWYTEEMLKEVREYTADMETETLIEQYDESQNTALYREFYWKKDREGLFYMQAVGHILLERGVLCGRSCLPGLFFVDRRYTKAKPEPHDGTQVDSSTPDNGAEL